MQGNRRGLLRWGRLGAYHALPLLTRCSFPGRGAGRSRQQARMASRACWAPTAGSPWRKTPSTAPEAKVGSGRRGRCSGAGFACAGGSACPAASHHPPLPEAPRPVLHHGADPAAATCRQHGGKSPKIASSCSAVWQGRVLLRYQAASVWPEPSSPYRLDAASPPPRLRGVMSPTAPLWGERCSSALAARSSAPCTC